MEFVEVSATAMPIGSELDFEFHLSFGYRQAAHRARRIHAGASPHTVRWSAWELALSDGFSGFPTKNLFIRHLSDSLSGCEGGASQIHRGLDAGSVSRIGRGGGK
jgi:hypothetical protein